MAVAQLESESLLTVEEEGQWLLVWRRFRKHKLALAGMFTIIVVALSCFFAPWVAPYDPFVLEKNLETAQIVKNAPPSLEHFMGTDSIGRDVFSRLLYAGRISLLVAFTVTLISLSIGVFVGGISGYYGGWLDDVIQRFVEFLITLPLLPLLLAFSALMRGIELPGIPREWSSAIIISIILTAFGWMGYTNLVRGMVLSLRGQEFTEAAKALGMGDINIILKHMIPNALAPIIVAATLSLGGTIILESALSFLGFGIQLPVPTWGNMLNEYQNDMWTQPAKVFYPGLTIFVCTLAFNYVGDGLRDALDPRLKK
ncbi:MAG: ABC transporter permease [Anaerolineales bacterium]|jgi:peptide/nickel transport system permease protein|nr:ABC transporter permease [Anaerolineales bacterium]